MEPFEPLSTPRPYDSDDLEAAPPRVVPDPSAARDGNGGAGLAHDIRGIRLLRAADLMSRRVVAVDGGATAAEAVRRMREEHVSSLVIDRRGQVDTWGIVTSSDVIRKAVLPGRDLGSLRVYEIMTKPMLTVFPHLAIKFCLRLMEHAQVRRAGVSDGERLFGILSHSDIMAALRV